jgi:hypothetical protein
MPFILSDSYNYTFHSLGSIGSIVLLGYMVLPSIDNYSVVFMHFVSLLGIMTINQKYFDNFKSVRYLPDDKTTLPRLSHKDDVKTPTSCKCSLGEVAHKGEVA